MKSFFIVLWRIIRWIVYLILILMLPFAGTFGYAWIFENQPNGHTTVSYNTEILDNIYKTGQNIVIIKTNGVDISSGNIQVNDEENNTNLKFGEIAFIYENTTDEITYIAVEKDGADILNITKYYVSSDMDGGVGIANFDATYLILSSILLYTLICILAGLRRRKKRLKKIPADLSDENDAEDTHITDNPEIPEETEEQHEEENVFEEQLPGTIPEILGDETAGEMESEAEEEIKEEEHIDEIEGEDFWGDRIDSTKKGNEYKYVDEASRPEEEKEVTDIETKWCKVLAEMGDKEAQYTLAVFYVNGYKDIEKSTILAKYWLEKSANQGYEKAKKALIENE